MKLAPLVVTFILLVGGAARANRVDVSLISSSATAIPGSSLEVAFRFHILAGWHMYWINPGDSGMPPRVVWKLPEGVTAGPLRFPVPHKIALPDGLIAYGYENDFTLLTTISIDPNFDADRPIDLAAQVKWVVCSDECVSEKQDVSAKLGIGPLQPQNNEQFDAWHLEQPARLKLDDSAVDVSIGKPLGHGILSIAMPHDFESATEITLIPPPLDFLTFDQPAGLHAIVGGMMVTQPFSIAPGAHENVRTVMMMNFTDGKSKHQAVEVPLSFRFK